MQSSQQSRDFVVRVMTIFLGIIVTLVTTTLCIRVIQDGNSPLVADITGKLTWVVMASVGAIVALVTGRDMLASAGGASTPPTTTPGA